MQLENSINNRIFISICFFVGQLCSCHPEITWTIYSNIFLLFDLIISCLFLYFHKCSVLPLNDSRTSCILFVFPGLFRAAIAESASALSPWAYQNNLPKVSHYLATLMNPEFKKKKPTSSQLLKFMKSVPAKVIDKASYYLNQEVKTRKNQKTFILLIILFFVVWFGCWLHSDRTRIFLHSNNWARTWGSISY